MFEERGYLQETQKKPCGKGRESFFKSGVLLRITDGGKEGCGLALEVWMGKGWKGVSEMGRWLPMTSTSFRPLQRLPTLSGRQAKSQGMLRGNC